jgi:hypothetical protein
MEGDQNLSAHRDSGKRFPPSERHGSSRAAGKRQSISPLEGDPTMTTLETPTPEFHQALADVISRSAGGEPVEHDLSNPAETAYLEQLAIRGGMTPERYPALFATLRGEGPSSPASFDAAGSATPVQDDTSDFGPGQMVDYVSATPSGGLAQAAATFTRTKPVSTATVWLQVVNQYNDQTTVLATGQGIGFTEQTIKVVTDDSTALQLPSTGTNSAVMSWSVQYEDGTSEVSSLATRWAFQTDGDPVVLDPAQNPNRTRGDKTAIVVGLARGLNNPANNTDVDYWFWQKQFENTTLLVPMRGSMKFKHEIAPLGANNPSLIFCLARKEGGMSELVANKAQQYAPRFSIDPKDPTKLNFELLAGPDSAGNAIDFGKSPWVADTRTFFTAMVLVNFKKASIPVGWSSIVSSDKPDTNPADGVAFIKPIVYVWHCLAAGTQVTLPDGTTRAIESFNAGDLVLSGGPRPVMATLAQPHWGTVYVITTASGRSITCSGTHPFYVSDRAVPAASLTVGQALDSQTGPDLITGITQQQHNGQGLYNLWLDPTAAGPTTFLANGLVVGDHQVQVALLDPQQNPDQVRARLPERLRQDFDSHLQDTAVAA